MPTRLPTENRFSGESGFGGAAMKHLCTTCWRWKGRHNFRRDRGRPASRCKSCDQLSRMRRDRARSSILSDPRRDIQTAFAIVEDPR